MIELNKVINGDCLKIMKEIQGGSVHLAILDPPYNLGKEMVGDNMAANDYTLWLHSVLKEVKRVLNNTGSVYLFSSYTRSLDTALAEVKEFFNLRTVIAWIYYNGLITQNGFSGRWEPIIYATKGDEFVFNADEIRIPRKRIDKQYLKQYSPLGKVPENVWFLSREVYTPDRPSHPTVKPESLIERIVLASSNRGDIVLDPFLGSGTTAIVCEKLGRKWIGIEIDEKFYNMACERIRPHRVQQRIDGLGVL